MSDHYLVQEDGTSKLLLEDGSGALLLDPTAVLGDLTFLPSYPDRVPHLVVTREITFVTSAAVTVPVTIPIPDVLHTQWFLGSAPSSVPHRKPPSWMRSDAVAPFPDGLDPLPWLPSYPDRVPPRRLSTAVRSPFYVAPDPFDTFVAQSLGWLARFPDRVPHRRTWTPTSDVRYQTPPVFIDDGIPCTRLRDRTVTTTGLTTETTTTTDLTADGLVGTALIGETFCYE